MRTGRAWCGAFLFTAAAVCCAMGGEEAEVLTETTDSPPSGWTYSGLGSAYSDGGIKLDNTGDYVITKIYDASVTNIVIVSKGYSTSGTTLDIIASTDRIIWNNDKKQVLTPATTTTTQSFDFAEADGFRAFKLLMQKTDGNIGLYYVKVLYSDYSGPSPLAAPVALEATAVNEGGFTANWTEVDEAGGYRLDVWTFLGIPPTTATEGFDDYPSSTPEGWTIKNGDTKIYTSSGNFSAASPSVSLSETGHEIVTCVYPAAVTNFSFWYKGQSPSNSFLNVYAYCGEDWTQLARFAVTNSGAFTNYNFEANLQYTQFKLVYDKDKGNLALDDISASYGAATEHYIFSDEGVANTNFSLAGLTPGVYHYRVRAEDGERVSADSNVVTVDTEAEPVPPLIEPVLPQSVRLGGTLEFTVTVTPTEGDPVTATNAVAETPVSGAWSFEHGLFSFTPVCEDLGEQRFVFTAQDKDGWSEPMTVIVTVRRAQAQAVSMDAAAGSYAQDFDTLATSGTENEWDNLAWPLPAWSAFAKTAAATSYRASAGTSTAGGLYSLGADADRALGSLGSDSTNPLLYGLALTNATGQAVTNLNISFTAEQWRAANQAPQTLHFEYCVTNRALPLTEGAWRRVKALCFESPVVTNAADAVYAASGLAAQLPRPVAAGEVVLLRWRDPDDSGSDHALGIDDLAVTWAAGAMPDA
ncbi:MAG: hypothetical protein PHU80_10770, partial [Kiritimatiellae bacterium]|nr:hypothetical protein [Kiritimatiellia bacterium]